MPYTFTYAILEVSPKTFADIKRRLRKSGTLPDYLQKDDEHGWLIVFGTTALAVQKKRKTTKSKR
jgi:hypothetical protein